MKLLSNLREKRVMVSIFMILFTFFVFFYTQLHPIILTDTDDWYYVYYHRPAVPVWKNWNPSRILAETMMPLISQISAYVITPIIGNVFKALSLGYAITVSITFSVFFVFIYRLIFSNNKNIKISIYLTAFLVLCHYWIFRTAENANTYMFATKDACTYFYYVIPNLLNSIIVIYLMTSNQRKKSIHINGGLLVAIYFAIFSNIWGSIILMSYVISSLIMEFYDEFHNGSLKITRFIYDQRNYIGCIVLWGIAQLFEITGGRAKVGGQQSFFSALYETIQMAFKTFRLVSHRFLICILMLFIIGILVIVFEKDVQRIRVFIKLSIALIVLLIYLLLSCAKVSPAYILKTDVFYGLFFYGMCIILLCFDSIIMKFSRIEAIIPLMLIIIFFDCNSTGRTFIEANVEQWNPSVAYAICEDILLQVNTAQQEGKDSIDLYVPKFDSSDNWPYAIYANERLGTCLYKLGVIDAPINIKELIPSESKDYLLKGTIQKE